MIPVKSARGALRPADEGEGREEKGREFRRGAGAASSAGAGGGGG